MSVMWETATLVKNGVTYWLKDEKARALIKECYSPSNPPPSSGGAVASVNGKTGVVELDASDVGALPDTTVIPTKTSDLTNDSGFINASSVPPPSSQTPEPLGTAAAGASTDYSRADHVHQKPTYSKTDVGLGNVDNVLQYSATNPPPYPVSSVNGQTGAVSVAAYPGAQTIVNLIYPVGSIYISVNSNSPATLFGGTWERIEDTFLLAAGSGYAAGSTGGEASHTLTANEMPAHEHDGIYWGVGYKQTPYPWGLNNDGVGNGFSSTYSGTRGGPDDSHAMYTGETGGGQAHNNMPPYLAVYVWKRTA